MLRGMVVSDARISPMHAHLPENGRPFLAAKEVSTFGWDFFSLFLY
jgi:hypothetical protein